MAEIVLKNVSKIYENRFHAVNNINLRIEPKEFVIFVGPSGCGKSTTLRMIAGLEEITSGELWLGDVYANFLEARERELAMVFQNYALYPNMTVYKNLAFSLEIRGEKKQEVKNKVMEVAKLLGLEAVLDRRPKDLSGGQRQRVAIGNAIIRNPDILLMDEPLSNLDAKLRGQMRVELANLHKRLNNTIIYVTHDQTEAMTLGTRIVVMNEGEIQQIDTPERIYQNPINRFVAGFIGSPAMNFLEGNMVYRKKDISLNIDTYHFHFNEMMTDWIKKESVNGEITLGVRPECFFDAVQRKKQHREDLIEEAKIEVVVIHRELLGKEVLLYFELCGKTCCAKVSAENNTAIGEKCVLWVDLSKSCLFRQGRNENVFYCYRNAMSSEELENEL